MTLQPGRVSDCYLGLLLPPPPAGEPEAGSVLVVAPAALLHPAVPQPAGRTVYELVTGHPEREPGELVFLADLDGELRALADGSWDALGVAPDAVAAAVVARWRQGQVKGLQFDEMSFEEAGALARPEMSSVRGQLRARLTGRLQRAYRRWLDAAGRRRAGDRFL